MATVCYTRPTLTSARVITSYSVITSSRNVVSTSPGRTSFFLYSSTSCTVRSSRSVCSTYRSTRISVVLPRVYTTVVRYYTSRAVYITSRVILYSTSCSVSRPTPAAPPRSTPPPRSVTTYITTTRITPVAVTTTRTTGVPVPVPTTETLGVTDTTTETFGVTDRITTTEISLVSITATETLSQSTDTPIPQGGGTTGPRQAPIGAIVGGGVGGLVAAIILGFLIYYMCFRKTKGDLQENGQYLDHQRSISLSALDGQSSPSQGSSAFNPQIQEAWQANLDGSQGLQHQHIAQMQDGALHAPIDGGQPQAMQYQNASQDSHNMNPRAGHRYSHLRQDSLGGHGMAVPMRPLSTSTDEQGYYYPQPKAGQYLGHAEVQDSRW